LPPFDFNRDLDETIQTDVQKETKAMMTLTDGSQYEGEWDVNT